MRAITFRGKRIDNGEWVYGSLLDGDIIVVGTVDVDEEYIGINEWYSVDRETVGEYTGSKDKNSKELYEGDIYHLEDENILYVVVYQDTSFKGKQMGSSSYAGLTHWRDRTEIIGNIHESKEASA